MKKITSHEIALSALACAIATILLTVGMYSQILLFTGYLIGSIAMMLPLSKNSYVGYALSYIATCLLTLLFSSFRIWDVLPFVAFFGLHPLVNELQMKSKWKTWVWFIIKAVWFDGVMWLIWSLIFQITAPLPWINDYIWLFILVLCSAFFLFYDYTSFKARTLVNRLVEKITKKK